MKDVSKRLSFCTTVQGELKPCDSILTALSLHRTQTPMSKVTAFWNQHLIYFYRTSNTLLWCTCTVAMKYLYRYSVPQCQTMTLETLTELQKHSTTWPSKSWVRDERKLSTQPWNTRLQNACNKSCCKCDI